MTMIFDGLYAETYRVAIGDGTVPAIINHRTDLPRALGGGPRQAWRASCSSSHRFLHRPPP